MLENILYQHGIRSMCNRKHNVIVWNKVDNTRCHFIVNVIISIIKQGCAHLWGFFLFFCRVLPFCLTSLWMEMFTIFIFLSEKRFMIAYDEEQVQSLPWGLRCSFVSRMPHCWHCTRWKLKGGKLFRLIASEDEGNYLAEQPKRLRSLQVPRHACCYSKDVGL